jgi:hypothetical protein
MTIKKLVSEYKGSPNNSKGGDIADTVNAIQLWLDAGTSFAESNHTQITSALSEFKSVVINSLSSEVYVDDTIVVPSGKSLKTVHGIKIKMLPSANKMVICNEGLLRAFSTATMSWSAANGRRFTITWTNHGLSIGDVFCIQGATPVEFNTCFTVASVTNSSTFDAYANETPSAAISGSFNVKKCDMNTFVDVSGDYNKVGGNNGTGINTMGAVFSFIAKSSIRTRIDNTAKYAFQISAALDCDVDVGGISESDCAKFYGAIRDIRATVHGTSWDDCISVHCAEYGVYTVYQPAVGPIENIFITDFSVQQTKAAQSYSGNIVIYSDDIYKIDNVYIGNGSATGQGVGLTIKDASASPPAVATVGNVVVENVTLAGGAGVVCARVQTKVKRLELRNPNFVNSDISARIMDIEAAGIVDVFLVNGIVFDATKYTGSTVNMFNIVGSVDKVTITGAQIKGDATGKFLKLLQLGTNAVRSVVLNGSFSYLNVLVDTQAGASLKHSITYDSCVVDNCESGVLARSPANVYLNTSRFTSVANGAARSAASGNLIQVYDYGSQYSSANALSAVAGGLVQPMTPTTNANITNAIVNKAAGAFAFSTTAAGTIPANRPVVCDGTNWKDMTNLSNVF